MEILGGVKVKRRFPLDHLCKVSFQSISSIDNFFLFRIHVLSALHNHGWYLLTSTDVSKKQLDKDTLIFLLGIPPPQTAFFAVSFNDHDKLRLIGIPADLIPAVQRTLGPANIQKEEWRDGGAAYQFKL